MAFVGPLTLSGNVGGSGEGFLPRTVGGADPSDVRRQEAQIMASYPGVDRFTEYGTQPFGNQQMTTQALGFQYNGPDLFSGMPPTSVDALMANAPQAIGGAGRVSPETITAQTVGATPPSGGVIQTGLAGPASPAASPMDLGGSGGQGGPGAAGTGGSATGGGPGGEGAGPSGTGGTGGGEGAASGAGGGGTGDDGSASWHSGGSAESISKRKSISAKLLPGEFVVNPYAAKKYKAVLEYINNEGRQMAAKAGDKRSAGPKTGNSAHGGGMYDKGGAVSYDDGGSVDWNTIGRGAVAGYNAGSSGGGNDTMPTPNLGMVPSLPGGRTATGSRLLAQTSPDSGSSGSTKLGQTIGNLIRASGPWGNQDLGTRGATGGVSLSDQNRSSAVDQQGSAGGSAGADPWASVIDEL